MSRKSYEITLVTIQNSHHSIQNGFPCFRSWWKVKWAWHIASLILSEQLSWMEGTDEWWVYTSEKSKMDSKNDGLEEDCLFNHGDFGVHVSWLGVYIGCFILGWGMGYVELWWVVSLPSWILVTESYFWQLRVRYGVLWWPVKFEWCVSKWWESECFSQRKLGSLHSP